MEEDLEISAKTVEEAVQMALEQLGVDRDQVEVTVLKKGRLGILGLGAEEARIRVRRLDQALASGKDIIEVAKEVVEELLNRMAIPAAVRLEGSAVRETAIKFNIEGDDLGILIGRRGQTLASFQYIVRLILTNRVKGWVPVSVDVEGYKKRRYEALRSLALRIADQVKATCRPMTLEPMPADERRIVHLALADRTDVTTQSVGVGEGRKVTIMTNRR